MMRAVFINHCHPDVPHVCGLRAGRFAHTLAERGHRIVLITGPAPDGSVVSADADLAGMLADHDWRRPFVLPCAATGFDQARRARNGEIVGIGRKLAIARSYLFEGGMFPDWQSGVLPLLPELADHFRPDVVWGTFGNTDTWKLCRRLAHHAGCPWVGDFKDNWDAFVPIGFRGLMAKRLGVMAAMTVLSTAHCDQADVLFPHTIKTVIYSGVEAVGEGDALDPGGPLILTLTGSIYDRARLDGLMASLAGWLGRGGGRQMTLHYAGNEGELVERAAQAAGVPVRLVGYLGQTELHRLQASAHANLYIYNPRCLLHHKALELIAQGRPIFVYPDETAEVRSLAAEAGVSLFADADPAARADAIDMIAGAPPAAPAEARRRPFTWAARAGVLETVLEGVITGGGARS